MKIAIFSSLYYPHELGGAEVSTRLLAEALVKSGQAVIVFTTGPETGQKVIAGVQVCYMKQKNLYWMTDTKSKPAWIKPFWHWVDRYDRRMVDSIEKIISRERPDVAHTNTLAGLSVGVWDMLYRRGIPIVHTLRDYYLMCPKTDMFKNNSNCNGPCSSCRVFSALKMKYSAKIDAVIGISSYILNKHISEGYFQNTQVRNVIYNPVSQPGIGYRPNISRLPVRFGYVGSLSPHKGIEIALGVFKEIKNAELHIYGSSQNALYEEFLKRSYNGSQIKFMGRRSEKEIYKNIDVLIVPSLWNEPFGRIIPEAYSHGIPVIASRIGGIPELVDDGKTGYLFTPGSSDDLLDKLRRFINGANDKDEMSQLCLDRAQSFSADRQAREYLAVFDACVHYGK